MAGMNERMNARDKISAEEKESPNAGWTSR